jgi:hypothetical protein
MRANAQPHYERPNSRRDFLARAGGGFGALALAHLLESDPLRASTPANPLAPRQPHVRTRAKSVIFLFMEGGPSHIDMFDPKPALVGLHGKQLPSTFKQVVLPMGEQRSPLLASRRSFRRVGEVGHWASDWVPHFAEVADDVSLLQSCWCDGLNHVGSVCQMNTGSTLAGRPSLGSWTTYGLGTTNESLPAFVVLLDRKGTVAGGPRNWGTGFMSASHQGTLLRNGPEVIANLHPPKGVSTDRQRGKLDFLAGLNRRHLEERSDLSELEARIASYELAFRMQAEAPEAVDLGGETARTKELYGLDKKHTQGMGRACLLARRLVERGVRFVQVYSGAGSKWDSHSNLEKGHGEMCRSMDKPVVGLVRDLKQRGLLDETLVVWGGEFGRTPMSEKGNGRDHNPYGFTMWFAGAGVKPGLRVGTTDEVGLHAVDDRAHVFDIHATILRLMGLDHRRLTYLHNGRVERPTINQGEAIEKLLA